VNEPDAPFNRWLAELEQRHLSDLSFREVSAGLRALSSQYVERRQHLGEGLALQGAGKRAAFALFYGPIHFLVVRAILTALPGAADRAAAATVLDLGCGTGAAGAAWGSLCRSKPSIVGIDRHPWALAEAARTYRRFGLPARTRQADLAAAVLPNGPLAALAAFSLNELPEAARDGLLRRLIARAVPLLVVEPVAGFVAPWWDRWRTEVERAGGRADLWRFPGNLPPIVSKLDHAAGLDHRELTARSLWLAGSASRSW
jgi:hypothetical protein